MPFTTRLYYHTAPTGGVPAALRRGMQNRRFAAETLSAPAHKPRQECDDLKKYMYEGDAPAFDGETGPYFVVPRCYDPQLGRFLLRDP